MQQLEIYEESKLAKLEQLANDYRNLVVTRDNLKDADRARLTLKNARLEIQKIEKANNAILKEWVAQNKEKAAKFINITEPVEIRIAKDIDFIEAEIEMERRKEEERKARIRRLIQEITDKTAMVATTQRKDFIESCMSITTPDNLAEFTYEYNQALESLKIACTERMEFLLMKEEKEAKEKAEAEEIAKWEHLTFVFAESSNSLFIDNKFESGEGYKIFTAKEAYEFCKTMKLQLSQIPDLTQPDAVKEDISESDNSQAASYAVAEPGAGMFEPMLREIPKSEELRVKGGMAFSIGGPKVDLGTMPKYELPNEIKGEISAAMGVNTRPAHKLEHLGYWISFDPKMSDELFKKLSVAICDILDSEDLI